MTEKLAVSFSGGRTSALMTKICFDKYGKTHEIVVTFANTGCEHPETYEFVERCDKYFGFNVNWVEADINPKNWKGVRHRIVSYETASRDGSPYEDYVRKYGIPNKLRPQCSERLKVRPMESFLRTKGYRRGKKLNYDTAIGIRADEIDRVPASYKRERLIYPLIDAGITKQDVLKFWKTQPFDLQLPGEHYGNCTWCWKKSQRKLLTLMVESPDVFDFPERMELLYGAHKANLKTDKDGRRNFFRNHRSVNDLRVLSKSPFEKFIDNNALPFDRELDTGGSCGESCEVGADDNWFDSLLDELEDDNGKPTEEETEEG